MSESDISVEPQKREPFAILLQQKLKEHAINLYRPNHFHRPFLDQTEISLDFSPQVFGTSDHHLTGPMPGRLSREGLNSGKDLLPFTKPDQVQQTREVHTMGRHVLSEVFHLRGKLKSQDIVYFGGDTIQSSDTGSFLSAATTIEDNIARITPGNGDLSLIVAQGNHNYIHPLAPESIGNDQIVALRQPRLPNEIFQILVDAAQNGASFNQLSKAWNEVALHDQPDQPNHTQNDRFTVSGLQRWYLEQVIFGPQIGKIDTPKAQVVFLDSNQISHLITGGNTENSLKAALSAHHLSADSGLGAQISQEFHRQWTSQRLLIEETLNSTFSENKPTIIYTHAPELIEPELAKVHAVQAGIPIDQALAEVREKIKFVGGHRHLGQSADKKPHPNWTVIQSISRTVLGPLTENSPGSTTPYTPDSPVGILTGPIDNPHLISYDDATANFDSRRDTLSLP